MIKTLKNLFRPEQNKDETNARIRELEEKLASQALTSRSRVPNRPQWFEYFDPLQGAGLQTLIDARNEARRGAYARQMLIWDEILYSDGVLGMLFSRLTQEVASQEWTIEVANNSPEALKQKKQLQAFYEGVSGLNESFANLASALFYGYAHLQYVKDQWGKRFEFIPQKYWVRQGELNEWQFNPKVNIGTSAGESVKGQTLVILEHDHPILFPASRASFERNHAKIVWDNHMDRYGSAPAIITAPKEASLAVMDALEQACDELKSGGSVVLPQGCDAHPLQASNIGHEYFLSRINMADRDQVRFVMAGTLTVLTESGSGTLAGNAHENSWKNVIRAVCCKVANAFNKTLSPLILGEAEPLARLSIVFREQQSPQEKAYELATLAGADIKLSDAELVDKLGMDVKQGKESSAPKATEGGVKEPLDTHKQDPRTELQNRESDFAVSDDVYESLRKLLYAELMKPLNENDNSYRNQ